MTKEEDFLVNEPYKPTEKEQSAIKELEGKGLVAEDWDSGKKDIQNFKKNLRRDMYNKQNRRCAYCRIHVPLACDPMHREHIVYKDGHPQWMFLPENLCVSCYRCNVYKGTTEVLMNPKTAEYPKDSKGFKIIHPLYDRYSEHIELLNGILYRGKTAKGIFTIETCHLYRVDLAEERVDIKMHEENKGNIVADLICLITLPNHYVDDVDEFKRFIKEIVLKYKQGVV